MKTYTDPVTGQTVQVTVCPPSERGRSQPSVRPKSKSLASGMVRIVRDIQGQED